MDYFLDQDLPQFQLEHLNACCMLLQVTTLAEITAHTGMELLLQILTSHKCLTPQGLTNISLSTIQWVWVHPHHQCVEFLVLNCLHPLY